MSYWVALCPIGWSYVLLVGAMSYWLELCPVEGLLWRVSCRELAVVDAPVLL